MTRIFWDAMPAFLAAVLLVFGIMYFLAMQRLQSAIDQKAAEMEQIAAAINGEQK